MFVLSALDFGCIGTCQQQTMPFTVDYDGSVFLHLEQGGVVSITEIEVETGQPIVVEPIFPEHGVEYTFWFKDENGARIIHTIGPDDYDGFTVTILAGYETVALGACDDCEL